MAVYTGKFGGNSQLRGRILEDCGRVGGIPRKSTGWKCDNMGKKYPRLLFSALQEWGYWMVTHIFVQDAAVELLNVEITR